MVKMVILLVFIHMGKDDSLYRVINIKNYEFTRDVIVESVTSKQEYIVFDDADLIGNNQFSFIRIQGIYDCKLGILGDIDSQGEQYSVLSKAEIGKMNLAKVSNSHGDYFYFPDDPVIEVGGKISLDVKRYDLLSVNDVINDRTL